MEDSTLFKISLISSAIGILLLIFMSEKISPEEAKISSAKEGDYIKITGSVTNLQKKPDFVLFELQQGNEKIKVVAFGSSPIKNNDMVGVEGKVEYYKGDLEVNADIIRVI